MPKQKCRGRTDWQFFKKLNINLLYEVAVPCVDVDLTLTFSGLGKAMSQNIVVHSLEFEVSTGNSLTKLLTQAVDKANLGLSFTAEREITHLEKVQVASQEREAKGRYFLIIWWCELKPFFQWVGGGVVQNWAKSDSTVLCWWTQ